MASEEPNEVAGVTTIEEETPEKDPAPISNIPKHSLNGGKDGGPNKDSNSESSKSGAPKIVKAELEAKDTLSISTNDENENENVTNEKLVDSTSENASETQDFKLDVKDEIIESESDNKSMDSLKDDYNSNHNLELNKEELGKGRRARVPNKRYSDILSPRLAVEMPPTKIRRITVNGEAQANNDLVDQSHSDTPINRKKKNIDMKDPKFLKPLDCGWKRELVFRAQCEYGVKRAGDIYYYSPIGKKVRSMRELSECLDDTRLSLDDFTFYKESLGVGDPDREIIRDAKHRNANFDTGTNSKKKGKNKKHSMAVISSKAKPSPKGGFKVKWLPSGKSKSAAKKAKTYEDEDDGTEWETTPVTNKKDTGRGKLKNSRTSSQVAEPAISPSPPPSFRDTREEDKHFMQSYLQNLSYGYNTLISVFQHLKVQDLLRAGCVCTMWRDLASHPRLWRTVRMKNSQVHSFEGLTNALARHGTQQLDLRKMLLPNQDQTQWDSFSEAIKKVDTLRKIEFCRCPAIVVERIAESNRALEILNATTIKDEKINLKAFGNLLNLKELRIKSPTALTLTSDLSSLKELKKLRALSLTSIKELHSFNIAVLGEITSLEQLDIGDCVDLPKNFGPDILAKLVNLEKLRLEKGQGECHTFEMLTAVKDMPKLQQLELVNFDIKAGCDKILGGCTNLRKLLIIPTYISQSATTNHMVLGGVIRLRDTLSQFIWGVTLELLRVTELFVVQCDEDTNTKDKKKIVNVTDSIPVLKPVPVFGQLSDAPLITDPPGVEILSLQNLQKLLLQNLPKTKVKILKIPFHATWRQSITDSTV